MLLKKVDFEGLLLDVVPEEKYLKHPELYRNTNTTIEYVSEDGTKYILPHRVKSDTRYGVYDAGCVIFVNAPNKDDEEYNKYLYENNNIIDYKDIKSATDLVKKQTKLKEMESNVLMNNGNTFTPTVSDMDTAEMQCLKEAILAKNIDIDKYAHKFGENFLNDKRLFKGHTITMKKLISISEKLDLEVELRIRDTSNSVPNPMGTEIRKVLTGGNNE